jgi:hypothetical protein
MNLWGSMPDQSFTQHVVVNSYPQMANMYGMRNYGVGLYNGAYGLMGGPIGGGGFNGLVHPRTGTFQNTAYPTMTGFNFMNMGGMGNNLLNSLEVQLGMLMALLLGMGGGLNAESLFPRNDFTGIIDPFTGMFNPAANKKEQSPQTGTQPAAPGENKQETQPALPDKKQEKTHGNEAPKYNDQVPDTQPEVPPVSQPAVPTVPVNTITDEIIANMTQSNGLGGFDTVVKGLFGQDAFIIDMTGAHEGKLDRNDLIKYKDSTTGQWLIRPVGEDIYEIQSRTATITASQDMNARMRQGVVSFEGDMDKQKFNTKYWEEVSFGGHQYWQVKPGVSPADAINDVFTAQGRGLYAIDCAASINLALLKAKLDTVGAQDFNREFNGLALRGWDNWTVHPTTGQWINDANGGLDWAAGDHNNNNGDPSKLKPGDFVYFRNLDIEEGTSADQGENAIFLGFDPSGKPMFFGNPIGIIYDTVCKYGGLSEMRGGLSTGAIRKIDRNPVQSFAPPGR